MPISYPLNFPTTKGLRFINFRAQSAVGISISPFSLSQQVYVHQGDGWEVDVVAPPMVRADAEAYVAFILALNGREGTFLLGDPVNVTPRGTWAGSSPLLNGAHAARVKTLAIDGLAPSTTGLAGDWLQLGSGTGQRLHKVVQDFVANGSGQATVEIWPSLKAAQADNAPLVLASPKGFWRLASNTREWSIEIAQLYGLRFSALEAL